MSSKDDAVRDNELRDYLLGRTDGDAGERLDELSVSDDAVADRLSGIENELVDTYVRGELRGKDQRDFESHYLSTALRRKKVELARALSAAPARASAEADPGAESKDRHTPPKEGFRRGWGGGWLHAIPRWALAFALIAVLTVSTAWLAITDYRLHLQERAARDAYDALQKQYEQLREQAENRRSQPRPDGMKPGNDESVPVTQISSLFLPPPLRNTGSVPAVSVGAGDKWFQLQLGLESDDFPEYQIELKNLGGETLIWRSQPARSSEILHRRVVVVLIPGKAVQSKRTYGADVWGIAANGQKELMGTYVFQVIER